MFHNVSMMYPIVVIFCSFCINLILRAISGKKLCQKRMSVKEELYMI